MSSIPGLPTQGSDVTILITRVHLHPLCVLVEFWGKFSQDKTREYEWLAKDIQSPGNAFQEFEGNPGDQCLVQIDGTWYRSRIVSRNVSKYNVFLIDKGMSSSTTTSKLAWGKREHFGLPPEVEFCVLANVLPLSPESRWSPVAQEFLKSLAGKSMKAHVQDVLVPHRTFVLHIPCLSKQMYEMGFAKKLSSDMFHDFVFLSLQSQSTSQTHSSVQLSASAVSTQQISIGAGERLHKQELFMYPELPAGTVETVIVTEVTTPQRIFCQLKVFSQELRKLSDQLSQCCEGRRTSCLVGPEMIGFPCAARGNDGRWYRSLVQQIFPVNRVVEVLNIDYGTKQFVQVDNVKPLTGEFFRLPVVTYICSLHGIIDKGVGWTSSQIDFLRNLLLCKTVIAKFEYQSISEGVHYVTLYGDENTNINSQSACDFFVKAVTDKELNVHVTAKYDNVYVVQLTDLKAQGERDLSTLMCRSNLAESAETQRQHKAKMSIEPAALPPTQNPDSSLSGIHKNNGMSSRTRNAAGPTNIERKVPTFKEHMFPIGSVLNVSVSYIESPNDFWCQLVQNASHLKLLMHDIQAHYAGSEFQPLLETACIARHPDNGMWYRALVIHKHETAHVDVLFVDYGQTETVSLYDLRKICPAFLSLHGQAFRCSLLNPVDPTSAINEWNNEAVEKFHSFVQTAASNFVILKCTIYAVMYSEQKIVFNIVDLETPFESVCTSMVSLVQNAPPKKASGSSFRLDTYYYSTHNIKIGTEEQITVTCVNNVTQFYCQLERNTDVIKDLKIKVNNLCHQLQNVKLPAVFGTLCFAKYTDGHWYRGQIKATKPAVLVHFVDYGDTIEVDKSDLLPVPKEANDIMSIPLQAVMCGLSDIPANVPNKVNSWFDTSATESKFRALVVAREPDGKLMVELYQRNIQINSKIKKMFQIEMGCKQDIKRRNFSAPKPELLRKDESKAQNMNMHTASKSLRSVCEYGQKVKAAPLPLYRPPSQRETCGQMPSNVENMSQPAGAHAKQREENLTHQFESKSYCAEYQKENTVEKLPTLADLPLKSITPGMEADVYVSHCNSPLSFYVQLVREEGEINTIAEKLNDPTSTLQTSAIGDLHPGDLVQAEFADDASWYRAVVREIHGNMTAVVEFIDFGNTAMAPITKLGRLHQSFLQLPVFSIHCMLSDAAALGKEEMLDPEKCLAFREDIGGDGEKKLKCQFIRQSGSVWEVSLKDSGMNIICKASTRCLTDGSEIPEEVERTNTEPTQNSGKLSENPCSVSYCEQEFSEEQQLQIYITAVVDASSFWCQRADTGELDRIALSVSEVGSSVDTHVNPHTISPGCPCIALFSDDQLWYRGKVIRKDGDEVSILFVDYGNKSQVNIADVRVMPPSLVAAPPQAFLCGLQGFDSSFGSWTSDAVDALSALTADKLLKVTVTGVERDQENIKYLVQMECDGQLINKVMETWWKSLTSENNPDALGLTTSYEVDDLPFIHTKQLGKSFGAHCL
uniref:Tudor domain containing 6 n=1 Tax=Echeneis naucrates TaxID=173247 RepID=A0A665W2H9_ECHNA